MRKATARDGGRLSHCYPEADIGLRNNHWGTDSADSIQAWIFDGNDPQDPPWKANMVNVLYEPFSSVPLAAKETSMGGLKALFRWR